METQDTTTDWLAKEEATFQDTEKKTFEQLPSLKLVQNVITEVNIDFSKPFQKWFDEGNDVMKSIIPVTVNGAKMNWWLNIKNPVYAEIIRAGRQGVSVFKILQTGTAKQTKYTIIK